MIARSEERRRRDERRTIRLVVLAFVGALAFGFPLLGIASRDAQLFGVPILYVYLFGVWTLLIAGIAGLVERRSGRSADGRSHRRNRNDQ